MPDERIEALDLVLELVVLLGEDMATGLARDGLTVPRAHLLWEVRRQGPSTQRVLAAALRVSPRAVTGLVDGLEGAGLVVRAPHPTDRRATLVQFTERGRSLVEAMEAGQQDLAGVLFGGLSAGRLRDLTGTLGEVVARLRARLAADAGGGGR
ncbi:MarR family winged helix-turn-helix transcriptional regulator [Geodermatophilus sp. SYSU D00758]